MQGEGGRERKRGSEEGVFTSCLHFWRVNSTLRQHHCHHYHCHHYAPYTSHNHSNAQYSLHGIQ